MQANVYECMFILDPAKVSSDVPAAAKVLHGLIERHLGKILASRPWGDDRRLAYPIKSHKKGLYYLIYFSTEGPNVANLEKDLQLAEMVLRYMIIHVNEKLVDIMLQVAQDDRALALQTVNEQAAAEAEEGGDGGPPDRGRRGRRSGGDKDGD